MLTFAELVPLTIIVHQNKGWGGRVASIIMVPVTPRREGRHASAGYFVVRLNL